MSIITDLTRMWMTRPVKPFAFRNEYDQVLPYEECRDLGLYVHIPFCKQLCSFCPYCRELYSDEKCSRYLDALIREIHMVGGQRKKRVTGLYFGGGTPALAAPPPPFCGINSRSILFLCKNTAGELTMKAFPLR